MGNDINSKLATSSKVVGSLFGIGYLPLAPATWASAVVTVVIYFLYPRWFYLVAGIVIFTALGIWLADIVQKHTEKIDPRFFVFDELVGMMISLLFLPHRILWFGLAFFLFRVFDVIKPSPVHEVEKFDGGVGIVMDDILAGIYTLIVLSIARIGLKL